MLLVPSTSFLTSLSLTSTHLFYLTLITCSTGMFALWVYYKGLQKTPAPISAIVELAFPLTAVGVDYFLYNTVLTAPQIVAGAILLYTAYKVAHTHVQTAAVQTV
jgi:drug/metabolite transporter (DMT)-like permease